MAVFRFMYQNWRPSWIFASSKFCTPAGRWHHSDMKIRGSHDSETVHISNTYFLRGPNNIPPDYHLVPKAILESRSESRLQSTAVVLF